jgi:hypothetical protein
MICVPDGRSAPLSCSKMPEKIYRGERGLSGAIVTVDGAPLSPRRDIKVFSKAGFEWTYVGAVPQQLALALLADHLGDDAAAIAGSEAFMRNVVAHLDNAWSMTSREIVDALADLGL